jgi:hypothetical protein
MALSPETPLFPEPLLSGEPPDQDNTVQLDSPASDIDDAMLQYAVEASKRTNQPYIPPG